MVKDTCDLESGSSSMLVMTVLCLIRVGLTEVEIIIIFSRDITQPNAESGYLNFSHHVPSLMIKGLVEVKI